MVRLGFLIDQDSCIGCHACTVVCKQEHQVPLGVNRTWVKYIERGVFPDTQRTFSVLRCNHCDAAPCISICPTGALFRRSNGIVDFDTARCIGCKSCMNACPYDALYIDPDDHTAQKCNFCAHRVDVGLEPSCVMVCPTGSIITGDLDDPDARISQLLATNDVVVRAPEQHTSPKLFYKGLDAAALDPLQTAIADDGLMWSDTTRHHPTMPRGADRTGVSARTTSTTQHPVPWGPLVAAYLVTKSVAAGALMLAAIWALFHSGRPDLVGVGAPALAGFFTLVTGVLLVADLKRPDRFYFVLTRAQWGSWLTRGAVILGAYAVVCAAWFGAGIAGADGVVRVLAVPGFLLGAAAAGYTAFLFRQCEARDLWQTPVLLPILLGQAVVAGAGALAIAGAVVDVPSDRALCWSLLAGIAVVAACVVVELATPHTPHVATALAVLTRGECAGRFWGGGVAVGLVLPAALAAVALAGDGSVALEAIAGVCALAGLAAFEAAFVRAGQSVPLS